jgi:hypothetical protein
LFAEPSHLAGKKIETDVFAAHRAEIAAFAAAVTAAAVSFHATSYREWLASWMESTPAVAAHADNLLRVFQP